MRNKILKRIISAILIFAFVIPMSGVFAATDSKTVPGWSCEISNADGGILLDTSDDALGKASMKLWNKTIEKTGFVRCSYIFKDLKEGHTYRYGFSAKVKNANGTIYTQMNWDRSTMPSVKPFGSTADWRDFEFAYNHTSGEAALRFVLEGDTEGLWLDNFWFYDVSMPQTPENNLIKNPLFEEISETTPVAKEEKKEKIIPVSKKTDVKVDGDLSDWKEMNAYDLTIYTDYTKAPQTISGNIRYAYDTENFYFALSVTDDVHYPITEGSYWNGDGLQFTICAPDENFGISYGAVYDDKNNKTVKFGDTAYDVAAKRVGTKDMNA